MLLRVPARRIWAFVQCSNSILAQATQTQFAAEMGIGAELGVSAELGVRAVTQTAKTRRHKQCKPSCISCIKVHDRFIEQVVLLAVFTMVERSGCAMPLVSAKRLLHSDGVACSLYGDIGHHAICFETSSVATAPPCEKALLHHRIVIWLDVCTKQMQFWLIHSVQQQKGQ